MSMISNGQKLTVLTAELSRQWQNTKPYWRDAECQAFEQQYVETILTGVNATTEAIQKLDALINKIRRDCE